LHKRKITTKGGEILSSRYNFLFHSALLHFTTNLSNWHWFSIHFNNLAFLKTCFWTILTYNFQQLSHRVIPLIPSKGINGIVTRW